MTDYEKAMCALQEIDGVSEHLNSLPATLGRKIFGLRLEKGLSQVEFAKMLKVDLVTVCMVESGDKNIAIRFYDKALKALGVDPVEFEGK